MRIVICEDDNDHQSALCAAVERWKEISLHRSVSYVCYRSSEDLLGRWENGLCADLFILDIQIPGELDGMSLARRIRSKDQNVSIVFVTNYDSYVYDGYTVNALRYLRKPIEPTALFDCLDIAYRHFSLLSQESLVVNSCEQHFVLRYSDIICVEMHSHYLHLHLSSGENALRVRARLSDFGRQLPQKLFARCHRSYIVNLQHIRRLSKFALTMSNDQQVPVSQTYLLSLRNAFQWYHSAVNGINVCQ